MLTDPNPPVLSVVIPFYNEEMNLPSVLAELRAQLDAQTRTYEVIAVDDGSRDSTPQLLESLAETWPQLRALYLKPNQGQAPALWAGFKAVRGELVAVMDGDGQNDPAALPGIIQTLEETGVDMVAGIRANRKDTWLRRRMSRLANGIRQSLLQDGVNDAGCALKVMRRAVLSAFLPLRTLYSFMPAMAVSAGYRVVEKPVAHRPRTAGTSSYGLIAMLWRPAMDMVGLWWFCRRRFDNGRSQPADGGKVPWLRAWIWLLPMVLFTLLGQRGLNEPDEGRYAEVAREMAASGDWLVPRLNGFEHFQKPPLIYWATAASYRLFGTHETAARLPSALAAWGTVILLFFLVRRLWNSRTAHLACTILMSTMALFMSGRLLVPDTTLMFWIVAAITALVHRRPWAFFIAIGLGFLTKGPMAFVVPISAAIGWASTGGLPARWPWVRGLALALLIGLSWFLVMAVRQPQLLDYFVRYELIQRFASTTHGRSKPFWFFLPVLLLAFLPWTPWLPGLARTAWKRIRHRTLTPPQGLLLGWFVLPLLVLTLAGSKLPTYILPIMPALAAALGAAWHLNPPVRNPWRVAAPALAVWMLIIGLSAWGNDYLGRQASVRDICGTLQELLGTPSGQGAEVFVCSTRAQSVEFYLARCVGATRKETDLVFPPTPEQATRVFANARACARHYENRPGYGIMTEREFEKTFAPGGWRVLEKEGDFVLITHDLPPKAGARRQSS